MAKPDQNGESIRKKRCLRALQLAILLFESEAYFTDYLIEIEELIKDRYPEPNGLAIQLRMHF